MCETLHLIPSIKRKRRGKGKKRRKGRAGEREVGRKGRRREGRREEDGGKRKTKERERKEEGKYVSSFWLNGTPGLHYRGSCLCST